MPERLIRLNIINKFFIVIFSKLEYLKKIFEYVIFNVEEIKPPEVLAITSSAMNHKPYILTLYSGAKITGIIVKKSQKIAKKELGDNHDLVVFIDTINE